MPTSLSPKSRSVMAPEIDRSKWFSLPLEYELADSSGITTTIHGGDNTFDIELKWRETSLRAEVRPGPQTLDFNIP